MRATLLLLAFVLLLWFEWRYRRKSVRMLTIVIALVVWSYSQPSLTRASRRAILAPLPERVTTIGGNPIGEYESGVHTMTQAVEDEGKIVEKEYLLSLGVLLWLACSPVLPRARGPSVEKHTNDGDDISSGTPSRA